MSFADWFGRKTPAVRMPDVDVPPDIEAVFANARKAAAEAASAPLPHSGRHIVVVTPGRLLMFHPCPPAGSMPAAQVASIEKMISPAVKRNIAAIAFTELSAIQGNIAKTIPFLGILMGFAYVGHAVWIFEGHPSALAGGCRHAYVLIVDGAMVPHLQPGWKTVVAGAMRRPEIYIHDRATFGLRKA